LELSYVQGRVPGDGIGLAAGSGDFRVRVAKSISWPRKPPMTEWMINLRSLVEKAYL
jgi:hypothetical protein